MNILLGFAGRLGRLNYFLLTCALALVTTLLVFLLISALAPHYAAAHRATPDAPPSGMVLIIAAIVMPFFTWFSLALQAKRFRDMGWQPLYAIPGWMAAIFIDWCLAVALPSLAAGGSNHTIAGVLINLVMVGCLLFWPSAPDYGDYSNPPTPMPNRPAGGAAKPAVAAPPSEALRSTYPASTGFGRRVV